MKRRRGNYTAGLGQLCPCVEECKSCGFSKQSYRLTVQQVLNIIKGEIVCDNCGGILSVSKIDESVRDK